MNDLENLIKLAHVVARPWKISVCILGLLLAISMYANYKMAIKENVITIDADADHQSEITQSIEG